MLASSRTGAYSVGAAAGRALGQRPGRTTANMIIAIAMGGKAASSTPCQPQACSIRPALREPTADMPNTLKVVDG